MNVDTLIDNAVVYTKNVFSGESISKFDSMSDDVKERTFIKVTVAAALAGIVTRVLLPKAALIVVPAAVIYTFGRETTNYTVVNRMIDVVTERANQVKNNAASTVKCVNGALDGLYDFLTGS